jgi:DNA polymerase I-like protein with 3'-5' exonuclease and polymerase domains
MTRRDAFGFMWNDAPVEKKRGERKAPTPAGPRPRPEIPDNGWKPKPFPRLEKAVRIGFDTETKDLELDEKGPGVRRDGHIVGISVSVDEGDSWYFPMRHEIGENLPVENVLAWAKDELTRPNQPKVGLNLLYDLDYMAEAGVNVAGPFYDVGVAEALLDENADGYDLESISQRHLGKGKTTDALRKWLDEAYGAITRWRANIYRAPSNLVGPYAETDALNPLQILDKQLPLLNMQGMGKLWEIEAGLTEPLLAMRRRGVRIDLGQLDRVHARLTESIGEALARIKAKVGFDVNVDDKKHLIRIFDDLGLTYPRTAPSNSHPDGQPSFVKEFLEHHPHEVPKMITEIRRLERFKGTFCEGYLYKLHINGRIHCLFNQARSDEFGTVSGRFSSSLPNLQNIPARDELWGPLLRSMFIPDEGEDWGRLDWSQIEYRFLVHIANMVLNGMYGSGEAVRRYNEDPSTDYHQFVSDITAVARKIAKNINFGFVYGMGAPLLAQQLGLTIEAAQPIFDQYHAALPFVKEIRQRTAWRAGQDGYIETILKRRRRFDLWQPRYGDEQQIALPLHAARGKWGQQLKRAYTHKALNAEIQGSAADLMKLVMYLYWQRKDLVNELGCAC